jgi:hypothetical protein
VGEINITLHQLRGMIGLHVVHNGIRCQIIEVLEDGPSIVLQSLTSGGTIQSNQHGDATRRVTETYTIPVLTRDKTEIHPLYLALELE